MKRQKRKLTGRASFRVTEVCSWTSVRVRAHPCFPEAVMFSKKWGSWTTADPSRFHDADEKAATILSAALLWRGDS